MGNGNAELAGRQKEKLKTALRLLEQVKPASKEETTQILNDISALCDYMNVVDPQPDHYCPYYFDRTTCWRPIEAGSPARKSCPVYIDGFSNNAAIVSIVCKNDSTWNFHPASIDEFLEVYGPCAEPEGPSNSQYPSTSYLTSVLRIAQFSGVVGYCISLISLVVAAAIFLRFKKLAKSTCLLVIVLGGYYFIMSIPVLTMDNTILTEGLLSCLSIEHILSSLQGLLVAIIYCFCNHEVRAEIQRCWQRRLLLKSIPKPTEACNHHIVTSRQKNASISQSIKSQKDACIGASSPDQEIAPSPSRPDSSRWKSLWRKGVAKIAINGSHSPNWEQYDRRLSVHPGTCTTGTALSTVCNSVYSTVTAQNAQRFLGGTTSCSVEEHLQYSPLNPSTSSITSRMQTFRSDWSLAANRFPNVKQVFHQSEELVAVLEESSSGSFSEEMPLILHGENTNGLTEKEESYC